MSESLIAFQMMRVISSPSSSTTVPSTLILSMVLLGCLPFQADDSLPERGNYLDIETIPLGESSAGSELCRVARARYPFVMAKLRLEELSARTVVAANALTLKPGQEQFVAPVSYSAAAAVV